MPGMQEWRCLGRQAGNAAPVSLGRAVGNLLMSLIRNKPIKSYDGFKYSPYAGTCDRKSRAAVEQVALPQALTRL